MVKPKGLGRGLDALLAVNHSDDQLQTLPVTAIQPGKYQPRTRMDAASLESLAESIRAQGVIQPLVVRPVGYERYELIAGERRWRASQLAGLDAIPAIIRETSDSSMLRDALLETPGSPEDKHAQDRMRQMHALIEQLTDWFAEVRKLSPDTLQSLMSLGAGAVKLLEMKERVFGRASNDREVAP